MTDHRETDYFDTVCDYGDKLRILFVMFAAGFGISALVLPFIDRGTATWVVSIMNIVVLGGGLLATGIVRRQCGKRQRRRRQAIQNKNN